MTAARAWLAPEVVQTSAMDCGPAALKCLLEGFGIPASYGRLREACQTGVDGTSIDAIETVAGDLGLDAEQRLLPPDTLLDPDGPLPALVVVSRPDGATHFVVVWRRLGPWLQVMDPASGRRWVRARAFLDEVYRHAMSVPAAQWRDWAGSDDFRAPLRRRLLALGMAGPDADALVAAASADAGWFPLAALDAAARLGAGLRDAGALRPGPALARLVTTLHARTVAAPDDIHGLVSASWWSVAPDHQPRADGVRHVVLGGAVMLHVAGRRDGADGAPAQAPGLAPELAAALKEHMPHPLAALWRLLAADGVLGPAVLGAALAVAAAAMLAEAFLFRGLFDLGAVLAPGGQRLAAMAALLVFMAAVLAIRVPIAAEAMRFGRRLDTRLRMALLAKLPRLADRYFQSRPVSDMADRAHAIHAARAVPGMGVQMVQLGFELVLTLAGIAVIDIGSLPLATAIAACAVGLPALLQPRIVEADLRARSHQSALGGVHLDALMGIVPIRVHRAQAAIRRLHEGLLVAWTRAGATLLGLSVMASALQQALCLGLAGLLLVLHFRGSGGVSGSDLLLVYWVLKLPSLGRAMVALAHQYPAQRNVFMRLLEPLSAPEPSAAATAPARRTEGPVAVAIRGGRVVAGGHTLLDGVDLRIRPGEHVAIVGPSGAGKSTLLGLLLGWHRLAEGSLLVDGAPLDGERLDALRLRTAWVDPAVQLWNRSLVDNVMFAAPGGDLRHAAGALATAELRGMLERLPQGLQSSLGEGGAGISGGEGQRVRLARALVQVDAGLVLLDEPFRGMDRAQRRRLLEGARARWSAATLLCVSHDIVETLAFDRVVVVEDGRIVEDGPPAGLAAGDTRYAGLLAAERRAAEQAWQGRGWRRVLVEDGHVRHPG